MEENLNKRIRSSLRQKKTGRNSKITKKEQNYETHTNKKVLYLLIVIKKQNGAEQKINFWRE